MNETLTSAFKEVIQQLELIDTGRLYNETVVDLTVVNSIITIDIKAPEYLDFLIDKYPILDIWSTKPQVLSELELYVVPVLEQNILNSLEGDAQSQIDITLTVNGI